MTTSSIHWPAIIQHPGADELEYLAEPESLAAWQGRSTVRLIDSAGASYALQPAHTLTRQADSTLQEILGLVRAHAAQQGICCTPKIAAANIADAIKLMASLADD